MSVDGPARTSTALDTRALGATSSANAGTVASAAVPSSSAANQYRSVIKLLLLSNGKPFFPIGGGDVAANATGQFR